MLSVLCEGSELTILVVPRVHSGVPSNPYSCRPSRRANSRLEVALARKNKSIGRERRSYQDTTRRPGKGNNPVNDNNFAGPIIQGVQLRHGQWSSGRRTHKVCIQVRRRCLDYCLTFSPQHPRLLDWVCLRVHYAHAYRLILTANRPRCGPRVIDRVELDRLRSTKGHPIRGCAKGLVDEQ